MIFTWIDSRNHGSVDIRTSSYTYNESRNGKFRLIRATPFRIHHLHKYCGCEVAMATSHLSTSHINIAKAKKIYSVLTWI